MKVEAIDHHRNGISGAPFYAVLFREEKKGPLMLAAVFEDSCVVAVFDVDLAAAGNIRFCENSWRGDYFEADLRQAIAKWEAKREKEWQKTISQAKS